MYNKVRNDAWGSLIDDSATTFIYKKKRFVALSGTWTLSKHAEGEVSVNGFFASLCLETCVATMWTERDGTIIARNTLSSLPNFYVHAN